MGKILKADASADLAYAQFDLAAEPEVWLTLSVRFDAAALAFFTSGSSNDFGTVQDGSFLPVASVNLLATTPVWQIATGDTTATPTPVADTWTLLELHYVQSSQLVELYIDGSLAVDGNYIGGGDVEHILVGQANGSSFDADAIVYLDDVMVGTTRGASDLFSDDFEDGTLDAWSSTYGAVSVIDDPFGPAPLTTPEGVCIAFDDDTLAASPTWTRLDDPDGYRIATTWTIDRGRNDELDETGVGTATVSFIDTQGLLDPTNTGSPFFGLLVPRKQAALARWNPVTETWSTRFRGFVKRWLYRIDSSGEFAHVTLHLVDAFDLFDGLAMTPGDQGSTPPDESEGDIYFVGGPSAYKHVNQRIIEALADAGWPSSRQVIFSGNVTVQDTIYDRYGALGEVLRDAADAEFPGVANIYCNREGTVTFHGRFARFNPERPGYGINTWQLGGAPEAAGDSDVVPVKAIDFRMSDEDIYNVALPLPNGVDEDDVPGQLVTDPTSITTFGRRPMDGLDNLLTYQGHDDDGNTLDAVTEVRRFGEYYVDNYADAKVRVNLIEVSTRGPETFSGPASWAFVQGVDIGDVIHLTTTHPGGGGFDEDFFVEGIRENEGPMNDDFSQVDVELDVSPRSFFESNPFGEIPDNDDMAGAFVLPSSGAETAGNNEGFSNEGGDPDSSTSKDPVVQVFTSLFTGPGGDYGDEAPDTHNFRTAWWRWTVPAGWDAGSSVAVTLSNQTRVSCLLLALPGTSGIPPDNGDFTALGTGGAANTAGSTTSLIETESGTANIDVGDIVLIGVGVFDLSGGDFDLALVYTP